MSGWPFNKPKPNPIPLTPTTRLYTIQIIVRDTANQNIDGARVTLYTPAIVEAHTVQGLATLTIPSTLADTQLGVYASGYQDVDQHIVVTGIMQVWVGGGTPGSGMLCLPPMEAVYVPPIILPKGLTRMNGRVCQDDNGPMNAVGTTLMWGLHGCKFEESRLRQHYEWAADMGLQFFRMLGEVRDTDPNAEPFWKDLAIVPVGSADYPEWSDYERQVQACTQMALDHGMRVEWSIFGTGRDNKTRTVERWLAGVKPVMPGVQMTEVANESQGFSSDGAELREIASIIRSHLGQDHPLALTAVAEDDAMALYYGSAANLFTFHFDRTDGENGWRWVRQPWPGKDFGAFSDNEPKGDHSSIASDTDPERITMAGVNAFLVGACHHVIHTGAGVRGIDDPARGRVANLWDVPSFTQVLPAMKKWRALLPADLAQWTKENWYWPGHPFLIAENFIGDSALAANYGATRCFAATNGNRFIASPIGIMNEFPMVAKTAMRYTCYDWTGEPYMEGLAAKGEAFLFKNRYSSVVIGERV